MDKIGHWLLAKNMNAAIVAFVLTLLPMFGIPTGFLAAIVVGFITLRNGYKAGLFILAWVALPAISLLLLRRVGGFDLLLGRCVLVWLFAVVLRRYSAWRLVLEVAAGLGIIAVVVMHLTIPDIHQWWVGHITNYLKDVSKVTDLKLTSDQAQQFVHRFAHFASGFVCFIILLGSIIQLMIARWWQALLFNPGGFSKEFVNIRMSKTAALLLLAAGLGMLFNVAALVDVLPVLALPFMLAGLSFMHGICRGKQTLVILLVAIYIGFLFMPMLIGGFLACVGYVDSWTDLRRRVFVSKWG